MPYRTYKYCFSIHTPNPHNAYGCILSTPYYLYHYPDSPDTAWRPGELVTKPANQVMAYRQFVIDAGFYVCVFIISDAETSSFPDDPALRDFHSLIREVNKAESARWSDWFSAQVKTPMTTWDFGLATYPLGEDLSSFPHYPYAPKPQAPNILDILFNRKPDEKPWPITGEVYTPQ